MENVKTYIKRPENIELIQKAYDFAYEHHKEQFRKSGEPYVIHVIQVANTLAEMHCGPKTIAAGLLHDTVEDCEGVTTETITELFGEEIATLVDAVTKIGAIKFKDEEEYLASMIFLALTAWVVYCGVEKGIEKYSRYIMPGLLLLIIGIAIFSLTLSYTDESGMTRTGIEGLLVYIKPDFTGLTVQRFLNIALDAMSQLFFSLSVSMGIMITYGSYVKDDVDLNKANNQIEIFDTGVAFLAGLMIIPAVYVFLGTDGMASGPSLTFISLPKVFAAMGGVGRVVGAVFFLALGFAALTSCVSVMETLVANCMEIFHKSRKEMCAAVGVYSLVTAVLICLGYNALYFELPLPNGSTAQLLDVMDYISNSFLMPFISLLTSILVGWVVGPKWIIAEVEKNGEHFGRAKLYSVMMKYVVPVVMLILFLTSTGLGSLIFGG